MESAYLEYKKELGIKQEEMEQKRKEPATTKNITSKLKDKKAICERENISRINHKRKLEEMAKMKQEKKKIY